ncbi:hypothetical protein DHBDCA_p344 [Dehalobacter sp. DCA]|uniref:hypothetical protein n=1 Tax=unclassified Dehalobacter TaxID=2635733 RepID=UPI00028ACF38|nr:MULTISPECIES: hypothetical protein [unclassified Dehalobacter]AFV01372.1 hypothetical protein DHBDCA_p344 [Dehalobacter sp. DCA]
MKFFYGYADYSGILIEKCIVNNKKTNRRKQTACPKFINVDEFGTSCTVLAVPFILFFDSIFLTPSSSGILR